MYTWINNADIKISEAMDRHCQPLMRFSIALIFIWFGLLKPLGMSPEEDLIKRTVYWVSPQIFLPVLGWWEVAVGVCLLYRPLVRIALLLLFLQLPGTMLPLILLPEICFTHPPFGLSLEGQYIVKNIFLVSAAFMIGGKVRAQ
ncbi:MAG: hypothetical protein PHI06_12705 [Desulfobulbaceae bacterium]|nr:hypothetical protein [Desulfobulbaceae bacterium]